MSKAKENKVKYINVGETLDNGTMKDKMYVKSILIELGILRPLARDEELEGFRDLDVFRF